MTPDQRDKLDASHDCKQGDKCEGCNGHGEIGGLLPAGGGYHSEVCPFCNGSGVIPSVGDCPECVK